VPHNPVVFHYSDWAPYLQQIETQVRAIQERIEFRLDEDFAPVVVDLRCTDGSDVSGS
jgi:uncharacterized FlaG/YvyC family protein